MFAAAALSKFHQKFQRSYIFQWPVCGRASTLLMASANNISFPSFAMSWPLIQAKLDFFKIKVTVDLKACVFRAFAGSNKGILKCSLKQD